MNRSPVREPDAVRGRRQGCTYREGTESTSAAAVSRSPAPSLPLHSFPPVFRHVSVPKLKKLRFNKWFILLSAPFFFFCCFLAQSRSLMFPPSPVHVAPLCHPLCHLYYYKSDMYHCEWPRSSSSKFVRRRLFSVSVWFSWLFYVNMIGY